MPLHLTPEQAAALGAKSGAARPRKSRSTAGGPYHTRCVKCGEEFTTRAGEDRHLNATHHARYELVLNQEGTK